MISATLLFSLLFPSAVQSFDDWTALTPGIEFRWLRVASATSSVEARIALLRIDPAKWQLSLACQKQVGDSTGRTAEQWAKKFRFVAAINAGMFNRDYLTHTGFLVNRGVVNSPHVNNYQSVAVFDPFDTAHSTPFRIIDLDLPDISFSAIKKSYASCVQNLRLIKNPGVNCWQQQEKKWSEAALGQDKNGRILFIFSRSPFTMFDFNAVLLASDIGLVALQHLEGGPEAQLYIRIGKFKLDQFGSYETSFREDDGNGEAWPIPNVLGIRKKGSSK
jgi:exopolysaccharide biosynthesis protein